mgnify:FL=1
MGEAGIWIALILIGMVILGVREYARSSGTFAARLEQVKIALLASGLILLGVTATVLTVLYIIVVVVIEIWKPLLIIAMVIGGLISLCIWLGRARQ